MSNLKEFDAVEVLKDIGDAKKGSIGTIVEIFGKDAALVDFTEKNTGKSYATETIPLKDLKLIWEYKEEENE